MRRRKPICQALNLNVSRLLSCRKAAGYIHISQRRCNCFLYHRLIALSNNEPCPACFFGCAPTAIGTWQAAREAQPHDGYLGYQRVSLPRLDKRELKRNIWNRGCDPASCCRALRRMPSSFLTAQIVCKNKQISSQAFRCTEGPLAGPNMV